MSAPSALGLSVSVLYLLGTSRSNDVDGNENVKKKKNNKNRFNKKNNNFARASHCFVHFFPVLHDYDVKMPYFSSYGGRKQATTKFYFSF